MRIFPVKVFQAEVGAGSEAPAQPQLSAQEQLAGLFAQELAAERGETPEPASQGHQDTEQPAESAPEEAAPAEENAPEEGAETQEEAEPGDGAEEPTDSPAIAAPPGMSEADKAEFAKLPPALQTWINKRITEQQADYTRKTQQVAEQRKYYESSVAELQQKLQAYDHILSQFTTPKLAPPDPKMRDTDPVAYEEQLASYLHQKHLQEVAAAEQQRVRQEQEALQKQQMAEFYRREAEALAQMAPELADPKKGAALRKAVYEYGIKAGYTPEQLSMATARDMVTLWKAQRYDAMQEARKNIKPVPPAAPKAARPGPAKAIGRPSNVTRAVQQLVENPSRDALAAAYLAELQAER